MKKSLDFTLDQINGLLLITSKGREIHSYCILSKIMSSVFHIEPFGENQM